MTRANETSTADELLELRSAVSDLLKGDPELDYWCSEACLRRYLNSRGGHLRKAISALRHTLEWRKKERPHKLTWDVTEAAGYEGRVELLAEATKDGRPVILYRIRVPMKKMSGEELMRFWVYWLESAAHVADQCGNEKCVIIADFEHVPGVHLPPLVDRLHCLRIAQAHYPERLSLAIVANPASIFWLLWYGVQPFVDPVTRAKVALVKGEEVGEYISTLIDPEHMYETLGGRKSEKVDVDSIRDRMKQLDQDRQAMLAKALAAAPDE